MLDSTDLFKRTATGFVLITIIISGYMLTPPFLNTLLLCSLVYILLFEWPRIAHNNLSIWLLTPLYPIAPFILLILLNQNPIYHPLLFIMIATIASFDTGGYLIGSMYGRNLLLPHISPHKTWQGFWGGLVGGLIAYGSFSWLLGNTHLTLKNITINTIIICVSALIGDFFESSLKRQVGLKDSGTLLPGHGGLLDRFDAYLTAIVYVYAVRTLLWA